MNMTEILKAKGIADEIIQAILDDMKANKIYTASEENLDIRYGKLKTQHEGTENQLKEAQALIEQMKQATKGQEDLQQKVTEYETKMTQLQQEMEQTKIDSAIKVALLSSKAVDVDYLTFKLHEKLNKDGETLSLDDSGNIKGWDDKLKGLQTQFPNMFESSGNGKDGLQVLEPNRLKRGDGSGTPTREEFRAMNYDQRLALKKENEELYKQLAH
ncbi:MAG: phage scaffolding protein [Aristaeellaceae bacterium]